MIESGDKRDHDVWPVVTEHSRQLSDMTARLGGLETSVNAQSGRLDHIDSALVRIADKLDRPAEKVNVVAWLGLAITAILLMGTIGMLALKPVEARSLRNQEHIEETRVAQAFQNGQEAANIEWIREILRDVDRYGSRKWVGAGKSGGD